VCGDAIGKRSEIETAIGAAEDDPTDVRQRH
jgi:hypothetical protein